MGERRGDGRGGKKALGGLSGGLVIYLLFVESEARDIRGIYTAFTRWV